MPPAPTINVESNEAVAAQIATALQDWNERPVAVVTLALLIGTPSLGAAQGSVTAHRRLQSPKPAQGVIEVLNLFPYVGALLIVGMPNDVGFPVGIVAFWSGTLIHERAFLAAGHCTGPSSFAPLPPFIQAFVSLSPNARPLHLASSLEQITHPSIPPAFECLLLTATGARR